MTSGNTTYNGKGRAQQPSHGCSWKSRPKFHDMSSSFSESLRARNLTDVLNLHLWVSLASKWLARLMLSYSKVGVVLQIKPTTQYYRLSHAWCLTNPKHLCKIISFINEKAAWLTGKRRWLNVGGPQHVFWINTAWDVVVSISTLGRSII